MILIVNILQNIMIVSSLPTFGIIKYTLHHIMSWYDTSKPHIKLPPDTRHTQHLSDVTGPGNILVTVVTPVGVVHLGFPNDDLLLLWYVAIIVLHITPLMCSSALRINCKTMLHDIVMSLYVSSFNQWHFQDPMYVSITKWHLDCWQWHWYSMVSAGYRILTGTTISASGYWVVLSYKYQLITKDPAWFMGIL